MKRVLGLPPHKITKVYTFLQSLDEEQFKEDYSKMKYKELSKKYQCSLSIISKVIYYLHQQGKLQTKVLPKKVDKRNKLI